MTAAKQIEHMDLRELLEFQEGVLKHAAGGAVEERLRNAIAVRIAESQDREADALLTATRQLGTTTAKLVCATWDLVGATLVLVLAEVALKLLGRP
jgi:hypothetical protein